MSDGQLILLANLVVIAAALWIRYRRLGPAPSWLRFGRRPMRLIFLPVVIGVVYLFFAVIDWAIKVAK
jgi:hypothetical protein